MKIGSAIIPAVFVLIVLVSMPLLSINQRLKALNGTGIIEFELLFSTDKCNIVMDSWGDNGRALVQRSIFWDYPYLALYTILLVLVASRFSCKVATLPSLLTGSADILENILMTHCIQKKLPRLTPVFSSVAAVKFALLTLTIVLILRCVAAKSKKGNTV